VDSGISKPFTGARNRLFHLTQELKNCGNHVIVLEPQEFFDVDDAKLATIYTHPTYRVLNRGLKFFTDFDIWFITRLVQILRHEQIDLIAIDTACCTFAVRLAVTLTKTNVPIVYSPYDVESDFARDVIPQVAHFSQFERRIIPLYVAALEKLTAKYLANHIIMVSDAAKGQLCYKYRLDSEKVTVIPSGSELNKQLGQEEKDRVRAEMGLNSDSVIVVFHGSYAHPPNRNAIHTITDYVAPAFEANKSIVFVLYGTGLPKFERENVRSYGFAQNLHQALSIADIALVPLTSGGGTKLKIFDYMNACLPIISTKKGIEGINVKDKEHLILADNTNEMIDAIEYLIRNKQERERLGANARRLVENEYTWVTIGEKLDKTYRKLKEEKRAKVGGMT